MTLTKESWILIIICFIDTVSTVLLLHVNAAYEGNPLMAFYLRFGIGAFIMAKMAFVFLPIMVAEYAMTLSPKFTKFALRSAIAGYLGIYLVLFLKVNLMGIV